MVGDHDVNRNVASRGRAVRSANFALPRVPAIVGVSIDGKRAEDLRRAANVVGVLVGDPKEIERRSTQIAAQASDQPPVLGFTNAAAPGARWAVARVDQNVASVREIHQRGEALTHIVEVHSETMLARRRIRERGRGRGGRDCRRRAASGAGVRDVVRRDLRRDLRRDGRRDRRYRGAPERQLARWGLACRDERDGYRNALGSVGH